MTALRYLHLDVFPASPGGGNHLGVVIGAETWSATAMQRFACWVNLVETTFLLPAQSAEADYRVRIFTPEREIPFAGHPAIGSAHVALDCALAQPHDQLLRQESAAGILPLRVEGNGATRELLLRSPDAEVLATGLDAHALLPPALLNIKLGRLPPALVDGGRRWWVAEVADEASLRAWQPDHAALGALARASSSVGLCAFSRGNGFPNADGGAGSCQVVVRAFAPGAGIIEDPASGAANGLVASYLTRAEPGGKLARGYTVSQGREIGHDARLTVRIENGAIWVGGRCHTIIDGSLDWPATRDLQSR